MAEGGRGRPYGAGPRPGTAADSDRDSDRDGGPRPAEVPKGAGRGLDGPDTEPGSTRRRERRRRQGGPACHRATLPRLQLLLVCHIVWISQGYPNTKRLSWEYVRKTHYVVDIFDIRYRINMPSIVSHTGYVYPVNNAEPIF